MIGIVAVSLAGLIALSACSTDGPRDSGGVHMDFSAPKEIGAGDAIVNVPSFFKPPSIRRIEAVTRNNSITQQIFYLADGGKIFVEHSARGLNGADRFRSPERMVADAPAGTQVGKVFTDVISRNERVGIRADARIAGRDCVVARAAYLLAGPGIPGRPEIADTYVMATHCGDAAGRLAFDAMLANLDLVKDRAKFRAELQAGANRKVVITWDDVLDSAEGTLEWEKAGRAGSATLRVPSQTLTCTCTFQDANRSIGTWSASCDSDRQASGTVTYLGKDKGAMGVGSDSLGKLVKFTILPPED